MHQHFNVWKAISKDKNTSLGVAHVSADFALQKLFSEKEMFRSYFKNKIFK